VRESALTAALAQDVDAAFESLVILHQDRLYGLARHLLGDAHAAEEAAQDAFVRAYRALKGYPRERIRALMLRPWLYRILTNVVRNRVRGKRFALAPLERADGTPLELEDPAAERPEKLVERRETAHSLAAAVAELPDRLRLPVALRHIDGLPYAEIAAILGQPVGTVKANVHRGVARLRSMLEAV